MRSRFDEQLAELNKELIEMGALCEEVIAMVSQALTAGDPEQAGRWPRWMRRSTRRSATSSPCA